jgi:hypothetical protein
MPRTGTVTGRPAERDVAGGERPTRPGGQAGRADRRATCGPRPACDPGVWRPAREAPKPQPVVYNGLCEALFTVSCVAAE